MSILSCGLSRDERGGAAPRGTVSDLPLAVPPKDAWRLLGCSNSTGYELLAAGELDSFRLGRARRITVDSIRQLPPASPPARRRRDPPCPSQMQSPGLATPGSAELWQVLRAKVLRPIAQSRKNLFLPLS